MYSEVTAVIVLRSNVSIVLENHNGNRFMLDVIIQDILYKGWGPFVCIQIASVTYVFVA